MHGDLGLLGPGDALLLFSHSGRSDELLALVRAAAVPTVAVCGDAASPLSLAADAVIDAHVAGESDPHLPAPTASTTLALALGDCLALELARRRGFGRHDFARNHPGGHLGRMLPGGEGGEAGLG
jgi:D-arabinose 5-phosphate isomerase GutQ